MHITALHALRHAATDVSSSTLFGVPGALMLGAGATSPDPSSFQSWGWPGFAFFVAWGVFARWDKWQRCKHEAQRERWHAEHDKELDARMSQRVESYLSKVDAYIEQSIKDRGGSGPGTPRPNQPSQGDRP